MQKGSVYRQLHAEGPNYITVYVTLIRFLTILVIFLSYDKYRLGVFSFRCFQSNQGYL